MKKSVFSLFLISLLFFFSCDDEEFSSDPHDSNLVLIYFGSFEMGWEVLAPPVHTVNLYYSFYMGTREITYEEYDLFCLETDRTLPGENDCGRGDCPVILVSWYDAIKFCNWKSDAAGLPRAYNYAGELLDSSGSVTTDIREVRGYRLTTEAEWEYVARNKGARDGDQYSGSAVIDDVAWYSGNSSFQTHPVGTKDPNELGFYDMTGNAAEWCHDWMASYPSTSVNNPIGPGIFTNGNAIQRGGSYLLGESMFTPLRNSIRSQGVPYWKFGDTGFRIARTYFEE
jgi:formylglycine-generating enzyme required for sulfatase activity